MSEMLPDLQVFNAKEPQQALDAALATVQSYCGWHIAPSVTTSLDLWSPDSLAVFVPTLRLTAVSAVAQDSVTLSASTYTFERYGVIRRTPGAYFSPLSKVTVSFSHGFTVLPADVQDVVLLAAQRALSDTRGLVPRVSGGPAFMENRGPRLEPDDKDRLAPYVLTGFA